MVTPWTHTRSILGILRCAGVALLPLLFPVPMALWYICLGSFLFSYVDCTLSFYDRVGLASFLFGLLDGGLDTLYFAARCALCIILLIYEELGD